MQLYHASTGAAPDGVYSHFGSLLAAMHRIESIFAVSETRVLNDGKFHVYGPTWALGKVPEAERLRRIETPLQHLRAFADFLNTITVYQANLEFNKTLPLRDCWDNDPIGSGGLEILDEDSGLSDIQRRQLQKIFSPFSGIIYPENIFTQLLPPDIRTMEKAVQGNALFSA